MTLDVSIAQPTQALRKLQLSKRRASTFWASLCASCRADSVNANISREFHKERAWDITGSVLEHWNERLIYAVDAIFDLHRREILKGRAWDGSIDCWMVGRSQECTAPTVVLSCMDHGAVKRLMKRVAKDTTFQKSGFGLLGRPGCLKFVGGDGDGLQNAPPELPTVDACGLPMMMDIDNPDLQSVRRTATIGGVILVADRFYYLTAAHPFATIQKELPEGCGWRCEEGPWDHPWSPVTIEDLDSEGEESDADDPEDMSWPMSEGSTSEEKRIFPPYARVATCPPSDKLGQPPTPPKLVASFQHLRTTIKSIQTTSLEHDWALLVPEMAPISLINRFRFDGEDLDITGISNINENCRPLWIHEIYPETLPVDCSEAASLIPLPGGEGMVIAHKVYHSARPGESGSWIVDEKSGKLLGILVSASVQDECSYMLPSSAVFKSIGQSQKAYFGSGSPIVTLPSRGDLSSAYTALKLLRQALEDQRWAVVKPLLRDMNPTAITRKDYGLERSPLEIASEYGNESIVQALIEAGFAASQSALASALLRACEKGHVKVVKILLEAGADPTRDREILARASSAGHERVVQLLIQAGAAFQHALEKACANGHDAAVKILLEAGADFTKTSHWSDETQSLELAIRAGHDKVVKILLEAGVKPYHSCLLDASAAGNERVVELLLQANANVLSKSVEIAIQHGHDRVVNVLLEAGAQPSDSCLILASETGHVKVVQLLLPKASAIPNKDVRYAFCRAVENGHEDIVELFLQADVYIGVWGIEALCIALRRVHLKVAKLLIDSGVDAREARQQLAMDRSVGGREHIQQLLIAAGYHKSESEELPLKTAKSQMTNDILQRSQISERYRKADEVRKPSDC
ncbi:hypothetical protein LTS15_011121 [Exophiala xenobiotica]|nr:hypothetical protein LTS15_011121 [Exophiala xenobiotica]